MQYDNWLIKTWLYFCISQMGYIRKRREMTLKDNGSKTGIFAQSIKKENSYTIMMWGVGIDIPFKLKVSGYV